MLPSGVRRAAFLCVGRRAGTGGAGEGAMIVPGNNRRMQVRRKEKRKLFGKVRKETFVETLAATCNVAASRPSLG